MQNENAGDPVRGDVSSTLLKVPRSAAQTGLRTLWLERGKQFKYLFNYGNDLIHTGDGLLIGRADVILDEEGGSKGSLAVVDYKVSKDEEREDRY